MPKIIYLNQPHLVTCKGCILDASSKFNNITALAIDHDSSALIIADLGANSIRKASLTTFEVHKIVGSTSAIGHEDGPVNSATIRGPRSVVVDKRGIIYFCETYNTIRCIKQQDGQYLVSTIAGSQDEMGYVDGYCETALLNNPFGLAYSPNRDILFITDCNNNAIRAINISYTVHSLRNDLKRLIEFTGVLSDISVYIQHTRINLHTTLLSSRCNAYLQFLQT